MGGIFSYILTCHLEWKLRDDMLNDRLSNYVIPQKEQWTILRHAPSIGEKKYQKWHISSPTGNASKYLKGKISQIFDNEFHIACIYDNHQKISEILKPVEEQFSLKYIGSQLSCMQEHLLVFLSTKSQQTVLLKASRFRGFLLQDLATAEVSSKLNLHDLRLLIREGNIPTQLESLVTKYL